MEYPKQLISSLATQVDERLKTFCDLEAGRYLSTNDINTIITDTLWKFVKNETDTLDLRAVSAGQLKTRALKKNRWFKSLNESMERCPLDHMQNPFYKVQLDYKVMNGRNFHKLYNAKTVPEAVENILQSVQKWKDDKNSLLIDFPLIDIKTKKKVISCFQVDLIINLIAIIMASFDGNIGSYFSKKPEVLLNVPVFASTRFSILPQGGIDSYVATLLDAPIDNYNLKITFDNSNPVSPAEKFHLLDTRDNDLLLFLINSIKLDFYDSHTVVTDLAAAAKALYPRPSKRLYNDVVTRLHNMSKIHFEYTKEGNTLPSLSFNLLDTVATPTRDGKAKLVVTFGVMLYESVVKQNMIAVTSHNYNALEFNLSKLLYHTFQKERIILNNTATLTPEGMLHKKYDYSFFSRIVLFKSKKKQENVLAIKNALDEFITKRIAISSYNYNSDNNCFNIFFFPLSDDELADFVSDTGLFPKQLELPMDLLA